tara:strand:+ start:3196 stop:3513 length:318 start_codon:yes stop_codon:yes gene_type:complete
VLAETPVSITVTIRGLPAVDVREKPVTGMLMLPEAETLFKEEVKAGLVTGKTFIAPGALAVPMEPAEDTPVTAMTFIAPGSVTVPIELVEDKPDAETVISAMTHL